MSEIAEALKSASTETIIVEADSIANGKTIGDLKLRTATGVSVIAITHNGHTEINPGPETTIHAEECWYY